MKPVVQVTTYPFGVSNPAPIEKLEAAGLEVRLSPHGRKHTSAETAALLGDVDYLIAGTETLNSAVLKLGLPRLRMVAKNGVGLDGLDISYCQDQGVAVAYTPEAPARSVVEQVFGMLISLSRQFIASHEGLRRGEWNRLTGVLWQGKTLGILGCGRIGRQVAQVAQAFGIRVLAHDIQEDHEWAAQHQVTYVDLNTLLRESLAVTVHLPLDDSTRNILSADRLKEMSAQSYLINTCRGQVIDETALYQQLADGQLAGAAIDVYHKEPYNGPLTTLPNVFLTCHQGSCTVDGRFAMEMGSAENVLAYHLNQPLERERIVWLPDNYPHAAR